MMLVQHGGRIEAMSTTSHRRKNYAESTQMRSFCPFKTAVAPHVEAPVARLLRLATLDKGYVRDPQLRQSLIWG